MFKYETEHLVHESESLESIIHIESVSPSESLLHPESDDSLWPVSIRENPILKEQAETRRNLANKLGTLFESIPNATLDISEIIQQNKITKEQVDELYTELTTFLTQDSMNARILLYLPFELIPQANISLAADSFRGILKEQWQSLLTEKDFRTSFVDGDIPENATADTLPQVVKAAHLIPFLIQKQIITADEVQNIFEITDDQILKESIADALLVVADLKLVSQDDNHVEQAEQTNTTKNLQEELDEIDQIFKKQVGTISEARNEWIKKQKRETIISKYTEQMSDNIIKGSCNTLELLETANTVETKIIWILSVRKSVEKLASKPETLDQAKNIHQETAAIFTRLLNDDIQIKDAIESTWKRWSHITGIETPELPDIQAKYLEEINEDMSTMFSNPNLKDKLFPVSIAYGSKTKMYGRNSQDTDIAVFIKPNISPNEKENITSNFEGSHLQFWLSENGDTFEIQGNPGDVLEKTQVLFGGIWLGEQNSLKELYEKLLSPYLHSEGKKFGNHNIRKVWLSEIERSTLQYRLMHKGYQQSNIEQGGVSTHNSERIDSKSMFWDSGFRRLATTLFVKKVFLPNLDM